MKAYHICDWHVDISLELAVIEFSSLDDDEVGREVDAPGYGGRGDHHLDLHAHVQLFDSAAVSLNQTCLFDAGFTNTTINSMNSM